MRARFDNHIHQQLIKNIKVGCTQELGVPVFVVEDQHRFLLHHQIIRDGSDVDHVASIVPQTQRRFADFIAYSFDKAFHSVNNQAQLRE